MTVTLLPIYWQKKKFEPVWVLKNRREEIAKIELFDSVGGGKYFNASFILSGEYGEDFEIESETQDAKDYALKNAKEYLQDDFCANLASLTTIGQRTLYKSLFKD